MFHDLLHGRRTRLPLSAVCCRSFEDGQRHRQDQRQTEGQTTYKQAHRQACRRKDRWTDGQTQRQTDSQINRHTDRQIDIQKGRQRYKQIYRQTDRQTTDTHTYKLTGRYTGRLRGRQTYIEAYNIISTRRNLQTGIGAEESTDKESEKQTFQRWETDSKSGDLDRSPPTERASVQPNRGLILFFATHKSAALSLRPLITSSLVNETQPELRET